jgi:RNA polymerase sigma-70 factor (ECF subfamily)
MPESLKEASQAAYGGQMPALTTQLMGQVKAGDESAFDQLVTAVTPRGHTVAHSLVGSREDARELVQESLTKVYAARASYRNEEPFLPWFHRILRNACISFLRKRGRATTRSISSAIDDDGSDWEIEASELRPDQEAEATDTSAHVRAALDTLPLKHREILSLRHFEDLSYADISLQLGIPEGTVMSRLYHARRRLAERLGDLLET